jgi:UDP-2,3-diacylglucosamine hydrolase
LVAAWFVSDIHLKDINERSGIILLRFLHSLEANERPCTHLFLLGDIFDLWVGESRIFVDRFQPIVDVVGRLRRRGVEVHYFEGNHDVHVSKFWENQLAIPCWTDRKYFQLGDSTFRLEHGDLINLDDEAYLRYRRFYRHPIMEKVADLMPGVVWDKIGQWASKTSRKYSSRDRAAREVALREMIRTHATRAYTEAPFDVIVTGHMHIRDDYQFTGAGGRPVRSLNLGTWFESAMSLSYIDGQFAWVDLA